MRIYIVYADSCNEDDCGCYIEHVDSLWLKEEDAEKRRKEVYNGRVSFEEAK